MTTTERGHRRRADGSPPAFGRARPPQRVRQRLRVLGLPVATLVAVELIALCALAVAEKRLVVTIIASCVAAVILIGALLRRRGVRIGTWVAVRVAYLTRRRETLVAAAEYSSGGPSPDRTPERRPDRATPDTARDRVDLAPELEAFFPGMTLWESRTHDGDRMGVVQWHGMCAAILRVGPAAGLFRSRDTTENVPIEAVFAALDGPIGAELGIDSLQVLTQTIVGEQGRDLTPLLPAATTELFGARPRLRNRATFVAVRLDPVRAAAAVEVRGGGMLGISRVLSAALSRIRAAVRLAGLEVVVLDANEANRAIADSAYHQVTPYDPIIRWVESVRMVASTRMAHRSFVISDARRPALADLPVGNVFAYAVSTQGRPSADGGWSTRTVVRVTAKSPETLDSSCREIRAGARRAGVSLRPLDAVQFLGMRASAPIGGV